MHFFEVWLLFIVVFAVGCCMGAWFYRVLATSTLAPAQGIVADRVGDAIDGIKTRLGIGPDWRPLHQPAVERPLPRGVRPAPAEEEPAQPLLPAPPSWTGNGQGESEDWHDEEVWTEETGSDVSTDDYAAELKAKVEESAAAEAADDGSMMRPAGLSAPRSGVPDNLQRIWGIGRKNEELLHQLGIFHFGQIAAWTPAEARWIATHMAFPERVERDDWIGQAIVLASGGDLPHEKASRRRLLDDED